MNTTIDELLSTYDDLTLKYKKTRSFYRIESSLSFTYGTPDLEECDFCFYCNKCNNCVCCYACINCTRCILCVGQYNLKDGHYLLNKKVTKEEYQAVLKRLEEVWTQEI